MLIVLLLAALFAQILIGVPVGVALASSSAAFVLVSGQVPEMVVAHRMVNGVDSFPLLAVPFFILAGNLMNTAGITERIFGFARALVGWMPGGLGQVNIGASVIFAGMSGGRGGRCGGAWARSRSRPCATRATIRALRWASRRRPPPSGRSSRPRCPW